MPVAMTIELLDVMGLLLFAFVGGMLCGACLMVWAYGKEGR